LEDPIVAEEQLMAVRDRRVRILLYVVGAVLVLGMVILLLNEIYLHAPKVASYRTQRIQQIGEVVGVVSAIAAEIHLLALNAAIEAAGAGPTGGRFSIVAGEVKKLARRAQEEAKRIGSLVQEVQRANVMSVMATEQGLKETDKGAQQSREAAQANLELIDSVDSTTGQVRAITLATQQQRSATEQVVGTMRSLQDSAAQVADSSRELTTTLAQLNDLAAQLGGTDRTAAHYLPTGAASKGQD